MRALGEAAAQRCENAEEPKCVCRCRGKFHGANRGLVASIPAGDPHAIFVVCPMCKGEKAVEMTWAEGRKMKCPRCGAEGKVRYDRLRPSERRAIEKAEEAKRAFQNELPGMR